MTNASKGLVAVEQEIANEVRRAYYCGFEQALYNRELSVEAFFDAWFSHGCDYDPDPAEINALRLAALVSKPAAVEDEDTRAIPRLPRDKLLYWGPDYLDDHEGLARWRENAATGCGHDMIEGVNKNSFRRLLDTIERLRTALQRTDERAAIVAWLRKPQEPNFSACEYPEDFAMVRLGSAVSQTTRETIADAIEAGRHRDE